MSNPININLSPANMEGVTSQGFAVNAVLIETMCKSANGTKLTFQSGVEVEVKQSVTDIKKRVLQSISDNEAAAIAGADADSKE